MPRYDKYEPYAGGFRASLKTAIAAAAGFDAIGVGLDSDGLIVPGAGSTGIIGVMIPHGAKTAGAVVDTMTNGEIVEFTDDGTVEGGAADPGTKIYADPTTGELSDSDDAGATPVGFTVEGTRLVVRVAVPAAIAATEQAGG